MGDRLGIPGAVSFCILSIQVSLSYSSLFLVPLSWRIPNFRVLNLIDLQSSSSHSQGKITLVMGSINELHHARVFDRDGEVMEQKKRKNQVK